MVTIARNAIALATLGFRLPHFKNRSARSALRARTGSPRSQRSRSRANPDADS